MTNHVFSIRLRLWLTKKFGLITKRGCEAGQEGDNIWLLVSWLQV